MTTSKPTLFPLSNLVTPPDPTRAVKLRQMADKLNARIEQKRNTHRGANLTWKRQREIESANKDADRMEEQQVLMRALADLCESGVPDYLSGLKHGTQFEELVYEAQRSMNGRDPLSKTHAMTDWAVQVLAGANNGDRDRQRQIDRLIAQARLAGIPGFFPTPGSVSDGMLSHLCLSPGAQVLEPQAGDGQLADAIMARFPRVALSCLEWNYSLREILELKGYPVLGEDFLAYEGSGWDAIIMNPPFEKMQDVEHVRHAYGLVKPGGWLVSVVSESPFFNGNKKGKEFRAWLDEVGADVFDLEAGAFKESGTNVKARYIVVRK